MAVSCHVYLWMTSTVVGFNTKQQGKESAFSPLVLLQRLALLACRSCDTLERRRAHLTGLPVRPAVALGGPVIAERACQRGSIQPISHKNLTRCEGGEVAPSGSIIRLAVSHYTRSRNQIRC